MSLMAYVPKRRCWTSSAKKVIGPGQQPERSGSASLVSWSPGPLPTWTWTLLLLLKSRRRFSGLAWCDLSPYPLRMASMSSLISYSSAAESRWCFLSSRSGYPVNAISATGPNSNPSTNYCLELWPFNSSISSAQTEQANAMATIQIQ